MSKHWNPAFNAANYEIKEDTVICESFYQMREVKLRHQRFEGGQIELTRDLFWRPDAVCVLLYDPIRDVVVLIEQFRIGTIDHPRSPWLLELVAGLVEPGETIEEVARRESLEEAGAKIGRLEHICRFTPSPGGAREYVDLYCGCVNSDGIGGVHGLEGEGEDIKVHLFPVTTAVAMLKTGDVDNAAAIIAIQWLQLNHATIKDKWSVDAV
ncbi:MAG: NUDIX domain-containing protein [Pseudomonadales bacterium]|jgi:ADP-ribose pyrophosphatase